MKRVVKSSFNEEYDAKLRAVDIDVYKPTASVIKKLQEYRSRGSKVNVKAIKDIDKLFTYYYAAKLMDWRELAYAVEHDSSFRMFKYEDQLRAIDRQVKVDESLKDTRADMDIKLGLPDSHGLLTFESSSCWLPKSILNYFIENEIPVHFKKRTPGGQYDKNGTQWTEIEHLVIFPDTDPLEYDIAVHTNERADGSIPTTYTGMGTDERVSAKKIVDDLKKYTSK